jgi:hypothetical protein
MLQAIEEISHFRKCAISAIACDIYTESCLRPIGWQRQKGGCHKIILFTHPLTFAFVSLVNWMILFQRVKTPLHVHLQSEKQSFKAHFLKAISPILNRGSSTSDVTFLGMM